MMYLLKLVYPGGAEQPAGLYRDLADAQTALAAQPISGRFVGALIRAGELAVAGWQDAPGAPVAVRP